MGECGCAAYAGDVKFPGPKGITYVLEVYPSCSYCDAPAGVVIYAMDKENVKHWDVDSLPELTFIDNEVGIPVLHPDKLIKLCNKTYEGDEDMQWTCEEGIEVNFRDAVLEQIEENRKRLAQ